MILIGFKGKNKNQKSQNPKIRIGRTLEECLANLLGLIKPRKPKAFKSYYKRNQKQNQFKGTNNPKTWSMSIAYINIQFHRRECDSILKKQKQKLLFEFQKHQQIENLKAYTQNLPR